MKKWKKPEMNVLDIKMDENIAVSGTGDRPTAAKIILLHGSGTGRDIYKNCGYYTDTMTVINTSIPAGSSSYEDLSKTALETSNAIDDSGCHGGQFE